MPCEEIIVKGVISFACGKESEYYCEDGAGPRCLGHSHLTGCCQRMFWPESPLEADALGWPVGQYERLFGNA